MNGYLRSDPTGLRSLVNRLRGGRGKALARTTAVFAGGNISALVLRSIASLVVARFVEPATLLGHDLSIWYRDYNIVQEKVV